MDMQLTKSKTRRVTSGLDVFKIAGQSSLHFATFSITLG